VRISRRHLVFGIATFLATLVISHTSFAQRKVSLFFIERSKNANIVQYDANLASDGLFDGRSPVSAYWIMKAEDGHREELNRIERELAYGFSARVVEDRRSVWLTLVASKQRPVRLILGDDGVVRSETQIAGRKAYLTKIYVKASEGVMPKVEYIELFGRDPKTGAAVYERKTP